MVTWDRHGDGLLLSLSPEGVRFLREQWAWLRDLVCWQLSRCSSDPLATLAGLPVIVGPVDGRLAYVVDYWCGGEDPHPVRRVREGWVLHDLDVGLGRVLATLPRRGGIVHIPSQIGGARSDGALAEWGWMIETLHVVLDVSGRVSFEGDPSRALPPAPGPEETEVYRCSLRWLEAVLDVLAQAERAAQAPAGD